MPNKKEIPIIVSEGVGKTAWEFGRAGKAAGLISTVLYQLLRSSKEKDLHSRLVSRLLEVIQSDPVNDKGMRTIEHGNLSLLEGFDLYRQHRLMKYLPVAPLVEIDRMKGLCHISIGSFIPQRLLPIDTSMTHIAFVSVAAAIDFRREQFVVYSRTGEPLPIYEPASAKMVATVPEDCSLPILVLAGIQFLNVINGKAYPMAGRCLQIVKTDNSRKD